MNDSERDTLSSPCKYFRCLNDWDISYPSEQETPYRAESTCNIGLCGRKATIYPWGDFQGQPEPKDYIIHEQLHIAFKELMNGYSKEKEEDLIQDICRLIRKEK